MITITILSLTLMLMSILYLIARSKYKKLYNKTNKLINDLKSPLRHGYIKYGLTSTDKETGGVTSFEPVVFVKEMDRYTNGDSLLEIEKIDCNVNASLQSHESIRRYINDTFKTVYKTSDVIWLESEGKIKEQRKNKLEQLKEVIKNN